MGKDTKTQLSIAEQRYEQALLTMSRAQEDLSNAQAKVDLAYEELRLARIKAKKDKTTPVKEPSEDHPKFGCADFVFNHVTGEVTCNGKVIECAVFDWVATQAAGKADSVTITFACKSIKVIPESSLVEVRQAL